MAEFAWPPNPGHFPVRADFLESGAGGSWDWDIAGERLFFDARYAELYGLDPEAGRAGAPPQVFYSAIYPDDRARLKIALAGIFAGAETFSKEFRIQTPNGRVLWVHGRGKTYLDASDRPVRFMGTLTDVTQRKRTEERLRIAQSAGGVGTFEYQDGHATASVSAEFCRLLGLHPAEVLPVSTINRVVCTGEQQIIPEGDSRGGAPAAMPDLDFRIRRGDDNQVRWIARRGETIGDGDTSGHRYIGVIYDVTASKSAEERLRELNDSLEARVQEEIANREQAQDALRQSQKMEAVGHLTGGIAHDFNNLLTIIIGNIDTATRRLDSDADPRVRRSLDNAQKGAERAAALTQRLLAFSRRQPLSPKPTDVARLLAGMSDLLTRSIPEAVAIQVRPAADLWPIEVDQNQLENALLNLAVNARDAMPGGGELTISATNQTVAAASATQPAGDYVVIAVADTGTGMPEEVAARVFDPFFTTKEVGKGTGLGLSMVYGFARQSGGYVAIKTKVGAGTTVQISLPRLMDAGAVEPDGQLAYMRRGDTSETILVVEDDDDVRAYTVEALRELGYRVIEAHNGEAALHLLQRPEPRVNLLVSDVVMPAMSGRELADAALALQPNLRILFTSGYPRDVITRDGHLESGVDLLSKPFTVSSLGSKVRDLLDQP